MSVTDPPHPEQQSVRPPPIPGNVAPQPFDHLHGHDPLLEAQILGQPAG